MPNVELLDYDLRVQDAKLRAAERLQAQQEAQRQRDAQIEAMISSHVIDEDVFSERNHKQRIAFEIGELALADPLLTSVNREIFDTMASDHVAANSVNEDQVAAA